MSRHPQYGQRNVRCATQRSRRLTINDMSTQSMATRIERYETVVIGGGQAGLAVGYHLADRDVDFVILSDESRVGDNWRRRWDSLRLFTPAQYSALPGMHFPAP